MALPAATPEMVAEKCRRMDEGLNLWTGEPLTYEDTEVLNIGFDEEDSE